MSRLKQSILLFSVALLAMQTVFSVAPIYAAYAAPDADASNGAPKLDRPVGIKPDSTDNTEYYYYDGYTVHGAAGMYTEDVEFIPWIDTGAEDDTKNLFDGASTPEDFANIIDNDDPASNVINVKYTPKNKTMGIGNTNEYQETKTCESKDVPTRLWKPTKKERRELTGGIPAIYFTSRGDSAGATVDVVRDSAPDNISESKFNSIQDGNQDTGSSSDYGEGYADGRFRWGEFKNGAKELIDKYNKPKIEARDRALAENKPDEAARIEYEEIAENSLSSGTLAFKDTYFDWLGTDSAWILNDGVDCTYNFYKSFHSIVTPYVDDTLTLGLLDGKILGREGMPFDEYVEKGDARLAYKAFLQTHSGESIEKCNGLSDSYKCINQMNKSFMKCYAQAIGGTVDAINEAIDKGATGGISKKIDVWKDPDTDKFVDCYAGEPLTAYLGDAAAVREFAQGVIDNTDLPPTLRPQEADGPNDPVSTNETQCSLGALGWLLCPMFAFMANINDTIFDILKNWLVMIPFKADLSSDSSAAYELWGNLRNVINVAFIVFFLILIYAQVTGRGMSAYGVKSLLPRIIIGAILVNLSYTICAVAVDLSNSLGDSLYSLFNEANVNSAQIGNSISDGNVWKTVTASLTLLGGAAAGTAVMLANLSLLVPFLITVFITLVVTLFTLLARQAIIIVLVATSAFAFMLYVLPNTAGWFKKWAKMFLALLMLYPIFSLIFAGSNMAAELIRNTAGVNDETMLAIFSASIQVLPLLFLPLIIKLGGGVLNRFGGIINDPTKGPFDKLRNRGNEFRANAKVQQQARMLNRNNRFNISNYTGMNALGRRKVRKDHERSSRERNAHGAISRYTSRKADMAGKLGMGLMAGVRHSDLQNQLRDFISHGISEEELKDYKAALVRIEKSDPSDLYDPERFAEMQAAAVGAPDADGNIPSEAEQAAAMHKVMESNDVEAIDKMFDQIGNLSNLQLQAVQDAASKVSGSAAHLSAANIEQVYKNGGSGSQALYQNAANQGAYSANVMGSQDSAAVKGLDSAITDPEMRAKLLEAAETAKANNKVNNDMQASTRDALNGPGVFK